MRVYAYKVEGNDEMFFVVAGGIAEAVQMIVASPDAKNEVVSIIKLVSRNVLIKK